MNEQQFPEGDCESREKLSDKKHKWTPIITFVLGLLLGSGSIWQWMNVRIQNEKLSLEKMTQSVALREKISAKLLEVLKLIKDEDLKRQEVRQKYRMIEDDLLELERKLAKIEEREPRAFQYQDLIPPMPPASFRIKTR